MTLAAYDEAIIGVGSKRSSKELGSGAFRGAVARNAGRQVTRPHPLTGEAMAQPGVVVFVAGAPAFFPPDNPVESYEAA